MDYLSKNQQNHPYVYSSDNLRSRILNFTTPASFYYANLKDARELLHNYDVSPQAVNVVEYGIHGKVYLVYQGMTVIHSKLEVTMNAGATISDLKGELLKYAKLLIKFDVPTDV